MAQEYFGPHCPPEFVEQADVAVVMKGKKLIAHSKLLAKASPVFAGCLMGCSKAVGHKNSQALTLKQLPSEGQVQLSSVFSC